MSKTSANASTRRIAFQGAPGAYSDLACRQVYPELATLACAGFEDAIAAVREERAALAMLPIENSVAGRVADIHHLMPQSGLHIIGEHFQRVNHHLLALPGASLETIKSVRSHVHALSQCRNLIRSLGLKVVVAADTAGAAAEVKERGDPTVAAIASELAGADLWPAVAPAEHRGRGAQHDALSGDGARAPARCRMTAARSSPPSSSASATCRHRSTRRWAASPPMAST